MLNSVNVYVISNTVLNSTDPIFLYLKKNSPGVLSFLSPQLYPLWSHLCSRVEINATKTPPSGLLNNWSALLIAIICGNDQLHTIVLWISDMWSTYSKMNILCQMTIFHQSRDSTGKKILHGVAPSKCKLRVMSNFNCTLPFWDRFFHWSSQSPGYLDTKLVPR
jgi:hypothetical protein